MVAESSMFVSSQEFAQGARLEELREFARTEYSREEASWFLTQIRKAIAETFGVHKGRLCPHVVDDCPHN